MDINVDKNTRIKPEVTAKSQVVPSPPISERTPLALSDLTRFKSCDTKEYKIVRKISFFPVVRINYVFFGWPWRSEYQSKNRYFLGSPFSVILISNCALSERKGKKGSGKRWEGEELFVARRGLIVFFFITSSWGECQQMLTRGHSVADPSSSIPTVPSNTVWCWKKFKYNRLGAVFSFVIKICKMEY